MDIREQIAKETHYFDNAGVRHDNYAVANKILSLPDLKEALVLLELKREGKLYKLAKNQKLELVEHCFSSCTDCMNLRNKEIKHLGFKKVVKL